MGMMRVSSRKGKAHAREGRGKIENERRQDLKPKCQGWPFIASSRGKTEYRQVWRWVGLMV